MQYVKIIQRYRIRILAGFLLAGFLASGYATAQPFVDNYELAEPVPVTINHDEVHAALRKSFEFLKNEEPSFDVYWICKKIGGYLGGEYQQWAENLPSGVHDDLHALELIEDAGHPLRPMPAIGYPEDVAPRVVLKPYSMPPDKVKHMITFVRLGTKTLKECEQENIERLERYLSRPGTGYYLSHQLWILVMLYQRDCIGEARYLELARPMAELVLEELLADDKQFTDITAERAAFLCYAGLSSWVPEKTIRMALDSQLESGAWEVTDELPTDHQAHQAALTMFMLAHVWKEGRFAPPPSESEE